MRSGVLVALPPSRVDEPTMADLATQRDITTIPKVELHVHLNGSITEGTASELARRHGADPEQVLRLVDGRYPARYPDFEGFLHTYLAANQFVRTPDDLELVAGRASAASRPRSTRARESRRSTDEFSGTSRSELVTPPSPMFMTEEQPR